MASSDGSPDLSSEARQRPDAPLGTLIFRAGLVPADQLEDALEEGVRRGRRLGEILLERGLIREDDLARILAGQRGFPFLGPAELAPDPAAIHLLSEEKARLYRALPVRLDDGVPLVAITDPNNDLVLREITAALEVEPKFAVATRRDLLEALALAYSSADAANGDWARPETVREVFTPEPLDVPADNGEPLYSETVNGAEPEYVPDLDAAVPVETTPPEAPEETEEPAAPELAPEPEPVATSYDVPESPAPAEEVEGAHRVVVRLSNGERVEVARAEDRAEAERHARTFIRGLAGRELSDWPSVGGRFLRPDAIVSVDVVDVADDSG
jgi:type II secretion system (T2SS) protein E